MPPDCVRHTSPEMAELVASRRLFLTRKCADTHLGYALAQIKRARGQNKWINNPQPEARPRKEEFCFIIPRERGTVAERGAVPPLRPVPLARLGWDLAEYEVARVEHAHDLYRLYHLPGTARGVFHGDMLVCQSIPIEREHQDLVGLLLFVVSHQEGTRV